MVKRLTRSKKNRMIFGVCGGLAEYWNTDPTLVRIVYVLIMLITGLMPGIIAYLVAALIIPER